MDDRQDLRPDRLVVLQSVGDLGSQLAFSFGSSLPPIASISSAFARRYRKLTIPGDVFVSARL